MLRELRWWCKQKNNSNISHADSNKNLSVLTSLIKILNTRFYYNPLGNSRVLVLKTEREKCLEKLGDAFVELVIAIASKVVDKPLAYRGGGWGVQTSPPPKFRRPSKIRPNSTRLRKLLKIAEFRTPTPQDVRKKGSKILKLPRFAIVLH